MVLGRVSVVVGTGTLGVWGGAAATTALPRPRRPAMGVVGLSLVLVSAGMLLGCRSSFPDVDVANDVGVGERVEDEDKDAAENGRVESWAALVRREWVLVLVVWSWSWAWV